MQRPQRTVIRPRHRHRTSLLTGFDRSLPPRDWEWGIDRYQLMVSGSWRVQGNPTEYWTSALSLPDRAWLNQPEVGNGTVVVEGSQRATTTLASKFKLTASWRGNQQEVRIFLTANPTRTLAHILARAAITGIEPASILRSDPLTFFDQAPQGGVPRSLTSADNWLPDIDAAYAALGRDVFGAFLPIYVHQMQSFLTRLMTPFTPQAVVNEGATIVVRSAEGEVHLRWGEARVPQVESYFERYHRHAREAVLTAGQTALTDYHHVELLRFPGLESLSRIEGALAVTSAATAQDHPGIAIPLASSRRLAVYAKARDRIRFEVKREGRGRYDPSPRPEPEARLLSILNQERREAASAARWTEAFALFDEPELPTVGDLVSLMQAVVAACGTSDVVGAVMSALLTDGGISPLVEENVPSSAMLALLATGVVHRVRLQPRERGSSLRYGLSPFYRDVRSAVMEGFEAATRVRAAFEQPT